MAVTARLLGVFDLDAHIQTIRHAYRHKRDLMLKTMREAFPPSVALTEAAGGLFTWVSFPDGFDATTFMTDKALPQARVAYVPGATFFPVHQEPTTPGSATRAWQTTGWSMRSTASDISSPLSWSADHSPSGHHDAPEQTADGGPAGYVR
jgi:hypothetical protein